MNWKFVLVLPLLLSAACGTILAPSATPKHADYNAPAHTGASAAVTLGASPEAITINPTASDSDNYLDASIDYIGTMTYNASAANDSPYTVTLTENANNLSYSGAPLKWDIGIDPSTPLDLSASSSSGGLTLNLNDFTLTHLNANTSSGSVEAYLPATEQPYEAALSTSSGSVTATAEDGAQINFTALNSSSGNVTLNTGSASVLSAEVQTSSGVVTVNSADGAVVSAKITVSSGAINLNLAANATATFTISSSSGAITAKVTQDAAVRLEVVQHSSGSVSVPAGMQRVSGDDKTGVWETPGFDQAEHPITITVQNLSSGSITVQ